MTCSAYVLYRERRKRGTGKPYQKVVRWFARDVDVHEQVIKDDLARFGASVTELIRCAGRIVATISAIEEPYFGGTSAEISIKYRCDTCGCDIFPELPRTAEFLSTFITDVINDRKG